MDILSKSLLERFRRRTLAHFYILSASEESYLNDWTNQLLTQIICEDGTDPQTAQRRLKQGHPDILWLSPKDNRYKIQDRDLDPLFATMGHKPLELPWRFIVVEKPDAIGDAYANKLLKTLEEPIDACTIIFLQASTRPLLATIESRAIKLRLTENSKRQLPTPDSGQTLASYLGIWSKAFPEFYEQALDLPQTGPALASDLSNLSRSKPHIEENLMAGVMNWASYEQADCSALEEIINAAKHGHLSKIYNNSVAERFMLLINAANSGQ